MSTAPNENAIFYTPSEIAAMFNDAQKAAASAAHKEACRKATEAFHRTYYDTYAETQEREFAQQVSSRVPIMKIVAPAAA